MIGCITPISLKISSTSLSLRSSIRHAISSCKSRSPSSSLSTFSASGHPSFPADCRQSGKERLNLSLCELFVSGKHLRFWSFSCPLRPEKDLISAFLRANIKSCCEVRLDFLAKPCPTSPWLLQGPSAGLEFANTTRRFWKLLGWRQFLSGINGHR